MYAVVCCSDLLQLETPPRTNSGNKSQRRVVHFTPGAKKNLAQHDLLTTTPDDSGLVHFDDDEVNASSCTSILYYCSVTGGHVSWFHL